MKIVKLGSVLVASMFVANSFGQVQRSTERKEAAGQESTVKMKQTPEELAKVQTDKLSQILLLTDDQYAKVFETNMYVNMKNEAVGENTAWNQAQKNEAYEGNNAGRTGLIKSYLTPEQVVKYEEMQAKRELRREEKSHENVRQETNELKEERVNNKK